MFFFLFSYLEPFIFKVYVVCKKSYFREFIVGKKQITKNHKLNIINQNEIVQH